MKVIEQLIAHFDGQGRLSKPQLDQFIQKGFWGTRSPGDLRKVEHNTGQTYYFKVTGAMNGVVWGTDVYTSDSSLESACVHAGVLKVGETGVVKVTIVQPIAVFNGSRRNGVLSQMWTTGWGGAFRVEAINQ